MFCAMFHHKKKMFPLGISWHLDGVVHTFLGTRDPSNGILLIFFFLGGGGAILYMHLCHRLSDLQCGLRFMIILRLIVT